MRKILIFISAFFCVQIVAAAEVSEYSTGTARDDKGKVVYIEKHKSVFSKGQLKKLGTEYFTNNGKLFGAINSDFSESSYVPVYKFTDSRFGRSDEIQWAGRQIKAIAKEKESAATEYKHFDLQDNLVAGQGLHNFLRVNLDSFKKNTELKKNINFLIPMNQDVYSFRIRTKDLNEDKRTITLRIEADSWLFRMIAPHIDVTYNLDNNRLIEYDGPSNLLGAEGEKMNVVISYKYKES